MRRAEGCGRSALQETKEELELQRTKNVELLTQLAYRRDEVEGLNSALRQTKARSPRPHRLCMRERAMPRL
mgnify:FL=1